MKRSDERILTTHVGSLPRPKKLVKLLNKKDSGERVNKEKFDKIAREATKEAIKRQEEVGIDVINNGEQPRVGFDTYVYNRMNGFNGTKRRNQIQDIEEFPEYAENAFPEIGVKVMDTPKASNPVKYNDPSYAKVELNEFHELTENINYEEKFFTAASPGAISGILLNDHYNNHKEYVYALAEEMKKEYELIANTNTILQLDCPDLAMERHWMFKNKTDKEFQNIVELHIDAINKATKNIPKNQLRLHVCWGNYEGPHHKDIPLEKILPIIYEAEVEGISIELANPRHEHEHRTFKEHPLPEDKTLIPGVIDVKTNIIEHPKVVANRIERIADSIGNPSKILASTDCGFGTFAGWRIVGKEIAWKKLESLTKGAEIATKNLY